MTVSVLTPTIRKDALKLTEASLAQQTHEPLEWLVGSSFDPGVGSWVTDDFTGGFWTLNRIYQKMLEQAKGELIVFLQDNIWIPPDGIAKFTTNWRSGMAISGIGDQYARVNSWGKPEVKVWTDPRRQERYGSLYECQPEDWEINWACAGREDLLKCGGFLTDADFYGYGGDNVLLAERLAKIGVRFFLDQTNESFSIRHGRERGDWDKNHIYQNGTIEKLRQML